MLTLRQLPRSLFLSNNLPLEKKEKRYLFEFPLKISIQISIIEMKFKDLLNDVHTYIYRFIFLIYFKHNQRATQIARMKFEQAAINFLLHRWRTNYPYDSNATTAHTRTYIYIPNKFSATYDLFTCDTRDSSSILAREYKLCGNGTAPLHCYEKPGISRAKQFISISWSSRILCIN